jgi:hypothetical protein
MVLCKARLNQGVNGDFSLVACGKDTNLVAHGFFQANAGASWVAYHHGYWEGADFLSKINALYRHGSLS